MAFTPETKVAGDLIKSQDWNEAVDEVVRLEGDKVSKAGDAMTGPLTVDGNVGIGTDETPGPGRLTINSPHGDWIFLRQERSVEGGGGFRIHNPWREGDSEDRNRLEIGYRPSTGKTQWGTLVIQGPTGNVGIGTGDPDEKLHIEGGKLVVDEINVERDNRKYDDPYGKWILQGTMPRRGDDKFGWNIDNAFGTLVQYDSDYAFFGVKLEAPNRADAIIAWGDDSQENLRFLFGRHTVAEPEEHMRITADGTIGIGIKRPGARLHVINAFQDANGSTLVLGPKDASNLRMGYHHDYSWIQSHGNKPLAINPLGNNVGIGTTSPDTTLHASGSKSGGASPENHVVYVQNRSGNNADVLALRVNKAKPAGDNNFITFFGSGNRSIGAVQGDGSGGIQVAGPGNDYAEWLPRLQKDEVIGKGDIVGVLGGKITKGTDNAHHVMAISNGPIVVGNMPDKRDEHLYEKVVFVGQAKVKVRGAVSTGDYIVPSGLNDGTGKALAPQEMTPADYAQIVGRAWESLNEEGIKLINTAISLEPNFPWLENWFEALRTLQAEVKDLRARLANLTPLSTGMS